MRFGNKVNSYKNPRRRAVRDLALFIKVSLIYGKRSRFFQIVLPESKDHLHQDERGLCHGNIVTNNDCQCQWLSKERSGRFFCHLIK